MTPTSRAMLSRYRSWWGFLHAYVTHDFERKSPLEAVRVGERAIVVDVPGDALAKLSLSKSPSRVDTTSSCGPSGSYTLTSEHPVQQSRAGRDKPSASVLLGLGDVEADTQRFHFQWALLVLGEQ